MNGTRTIVLVITSFLIRGDRGEAAVSFVSDLAEKLARHVPIRVVAPSANPIRGAWIAGMEAFFSASSANPLSTLKLWKPADLLKNYLGPVCGSQRNARTCCRRFDSEYSWVLGAPRGGRAHGAACANDAPYSAWVFNSHIWSLSHIPNICSVLRNGIRGTANRYINGPELGDDTGRFRGRTFAFLPSMHRPSYRRSTSRFVTAVPHPASRPMPIASSVGPCVFYSQIGMSALRRRNRRCHE